MVRVALFSTVMFDRPVNASVQVAFMPITSSSCGVAFWIAVESITGFCVSTVGA